MRYSSELYTSRLLFVWLRLPGAFPLTYRVAIQPEVCIRIGEGWLIQLAAMNAQR